MIQKSSEIFLGRQPILDIGQHTVAYELLFRSGQTAASGVTDDLMATSTVIINTISHIGIDSVLDIHSGFINVSRELLMSDTLELLPRERIVLELLETVEITQEIVERCQQLKAKGFRLALDDFEYSSAYNQLFPIVEIIKFDVMLSPRDKIHQTLEYLRAWPHLKMLAEKVETEAEFEHFKALGFHFYQGYFFAKPSILTAKKSNPNQVTLIRALSLIMGDEELSEIEKVFKESPDLMLGLLRLVNSVGMGLAYKIGSLHQALVVLGRRQIQRWVQLLLYAQSSGDTSSPLMQMAAVRAKLMELLCQNHIEKRYNSDETSDHAFMTGILSLVDAALGTAMEEILNKLGLVDDVKIAILKREGFLGRLLLLTEKLETESFEEVAALMEELKISHTNLSEAQLTAMKWAANLDKQSDAQ